MVSTIFPLTNSSIKEERKKLRRRSIIREFSLNTSTHGLPGIARGESIHNRLYWSIAFILFFGIMTFFVTQSLIDYFGYPTQIDIDIKQDASQYFPSFSICNACPFRLDRIKVPLFNFTNTFYLTQLNNTSPLTPSLTQYIADFSVYTVNNNGTADSHFYSLSTMLYSCSYNSRPCSTYDFTRFISATYGLCHTFNAKTKNVNNSIRYIHQYGGHGKLDLELYIHGYQYVPYYWDSFGIVAVIHDNQQVPLMDTSGIELSPGRKHKLSFKKKKTELLSSPYTSCSDDVPLSVQRMLDSSYNNTDYSYSQSVCLQICEQTYTYVQCGCINPYAWNFRAITLPGTNTTIMAPLCNLTINNPCYYQATDALLNSPLLQEKYCSDCKQQCSITDFLIQTSSLLTPMEWKYDGIKQFVENSTVELPSDWSTAWHNYIETNYLSISVVLESTIVENSIQSAQFGIVDLLSNIGGQTGLWIGISFLSLLEFIEMFYRLIRHQCYSIGLKLRKKQQIIPS